MSIQSVNQGAYTTVKIEKWGKANKGGNTSVWGSLRNAGYSDKEIAEQNLVQKVAKENNLKDANVVHAGQELHIPMKIKDKREAGDATPPKSDPANSHSFVQIQSGYLSLRCCWQFRQTTSG